METQSLIIICLIILPIILYYLDWIITLMCVLYLAMWAFTLGGTLVSGLIASEYYPSMLYTVFLLLWASSTLLAYLSFKIQAWMGLNVIDTGIKDKWIKKQLEKIKSYGK